MPLFRSNSSLTPSQYLPSVDFIAYYKIYNSADGGGSAFRSSMSVPRRRRRQTQREHYGYLKDSPRILEIHPERLGLLWALSTSSEGGGVP